jgi:hypothetical protein
MEEGFMKTARFLLAICFILIIASNVYAFDDFIRGVWVTLSGNNPKEFSCTPGMLHYDSSNIDWLCARQMSTSAGYRFTANVDIATYVIKFTSPPPPSRAREGCPQIGVKLS